MFLYKTDGPSLRSGYLASCAAFPDQTALVVRGQTLSYHTLETTSRRWAAAMLQALGGRVERVGIFAYRSATAYTGTLAALMAGATFVPLNPTFPDQRTRSMICQAALDAIIVDSTCVSHLPEVLSGLQNVPLLLLPESEPPAGFTHCLDRTELFCAPLDELPPIVSEDIAYLLFTSGSTGEPKGVPVTHGNVMQFLQFAIAHYGITPTDRFSQAFDQTFDLSVFDLFVAWHSGASVYAITPVELLAPTAFINRNALTVWFSVPSVPAQMQKRRTLQPNSLPSLRWSLFCGEPLAISSARAWGAAAPNSTLENLYGPTELTIACFVHRWDPERSPEMSVNEIVPIGKPFPGLSAVILDESMKPVPSGTAGELWVGGPQTSPGYWHNLAQTEQRFVRLAVSDHENRLFYRTGDRVLRTDRGEFLFLGRADDQIKVLGHRVELGEVEAVLRRYPNVAQAVAVGWPIENGVAHAIEGFVTGTDLDEHRLVEHARAALPAYMAPERIHALDAMPLNANGKIDRRKLQQQLQAMTHSRSS